MTARQSAVVPPVRRVGLARALLVESSISAALRISAALPWEKRPGVVDHHLEPMPMTISSPAIAMTLPALAAQPSTRTVTGRGGPAARWRSPPLAGVTARAVEVQFDLVDVEEATSRTKSSAVMPHQPPMTVEDVDVSRLLRLAVVVLLADDLAADGADVEPLAAVGAGEVGERGAAEILQATGHELLPGVVKGARGGRPTRSRM
jgi:hypothetical protein